MPAWKGERARRRCDRAAQWRHVTPCMTRSRHRRRQHHVWCRHPNLARNPVRSTYLYHRRVFNPPEGSPCRVAASTERFAAPRANLLGVVQLLRVCYLPEGIEGQSRYPVSLNSHIRPSPQLRAVTHRSTSKAGSCIGFRWSWASVWLRRGPERGVSRARSSFARMALRILSNPAA